MLTPPSSSPKANNTITQPLNPTTKMALFCCTLPPWCSPPTNPANALVYAFLLIWHCVIPIHVTTPEVECVLWRGLHLHLHCWETDTHIWHRTNTAFPLEAPVLPTRKQDQFTHSWLCVRNAGACLVLSTKVYSGCDCMHWEITHPPTHTPTSD